MEDALLEIAKQIPAVLVLVWLVVKNNKDAADARNAFIDHIEKVQHRHQETISTMGSECHAVQEKCVAALERNTEMFGRMIESMERMEGTLDAHERALRPRPE